LLIHGGESNFEALSEPSFALLDIHQNQFVTLQAQTIPSQLSPETSHLFSHDNNYFLLTDNALLRIDIV
jgi:hypothetical protein